MKILFTGASSHTGYWFVKELVGAGHDVTVILHRPIADYDGIRKERVDDLVKISSPFYGISFGDSRFIEIVKGNTWDLFCHHAADVNNYRSPDFDTINALKQNTNNLQNVLTSLKSVGCNHVLLTGSRDEHNEGAGTLPLETFGPYWLSKEFTWEMFRYYARINKMNIGKFVISTAFGPMEDPKFTSYLVQSWYKGEVPTVKTPKYIRDNIHVTLLTKAYKDFVETLPGSTGEVKICPSQYKGLQGDFASMFANEMEPRLGIPCKLNFFDQTEFPEPLERVGTTQLDIKKLNWDEKIAWDELAKFYIEHYSKLTSDRK